MAAILIPIIILVLIVGFSSGGSIIENLNLSTPGFNIDLGFGSLGAEGKKTVSQGSQASQGPQGSFQPAPSIFLDTIITDGPSEGARLIQTTIATFEFSGHITPEDTGERITFDTKIVGFDEDWKPTSGTQRKVTLPPGIQNYTFLVRAKVGGVVDPTPASRTFQTYTSPHFGTIDISGVTIPTSSRNSKITLNTKLAKDKEVNITGWTFETQIDKYIIPQGVMLFTGDVSTSKREDIVLQSGQKAIIESRHNPLANNINFRVNECFGFLEEEFNTSLPETNRCPKDFEFTKGEVSQYSPACQDFLLNKVKGCKIPDYSQNITIFADFSCVTLLKNLEDKFTYGYCLQQFSDEENFIRNTWYIYNEGNEFLRGGHDRITLFDESGMFVDKFLY